MTNKKSIKIRDIVNGYIIEKDNFPELSEEFCETLDEALEIAKRFLKFNKEDKQLSFDCKGNWS